MEYTNLLSELMHHISFSTSPTINTPSFTKKQQTWRTTEPAVSWSAKSPGYLKYWALVRHEDNKITVS